MDFEKTLDKFIKGLKDKGRSNSTVVAYHKDISQLNDFLSKQGIKNYAKVSLNHLNDWKEQFNKKGYAPKSVSRKINSLKTFFSFLAEEDVVAENVSSGVNHPVIEAKAPRILKVTEYRALRDACYSDKRLFAIVELLLQTGMRIGELARIRIKDLKFSDSGTGEINIPAFENEHQRVIPFNLRAQEAVKGYLKVRDNDKAQTDIVFITKTGRNFLIRNIRSAINQCFKKAGIKNATVNDLRHTYAAVQIRAGIRIKDLYKLLGHKRASTTERYLEYIKPETEEERSNPVEL